MRAPLTDHRLPRVVQCSPVWGSESDRLDPTSDPNIFGRYPVHQLMRLSCISLCSSQDVAIYEPSDSEQIFTSSSSMNVFTRLYLSRLVAKTQCSVDYCTLIPCSYLKNNTIYSTVEHARAIGNYTSDWTAAGSQSGTFSASTDLRTLAYSPARPSRTGIR